jgi:hypothetical protein
MFMLSNDLDAAGIFPFSIGFGSSKKKHIEEGINFK